MTIVLRMMPPRPGKHPVRLRGGASAILVLSTAVACATSSGPDPLRRPGVIAFYEEPIVIEVPATVRVGVPFEVVVRTYGGGCVSEGGTDVSLDGLTVDVRPYDLHTDAQICTTELAMFHHRATIAVGEPGRLEIRVHGVEMPADSPVMTVRSVVVEPPSTDW